MDITEAMKNILSKTIQQSSVLNEMVPSSSVNFAANAGYVSEKLYLLIQLYLQNKGWNPSVEVLQYFNEMKESSMFSTNAYLQMIASRLTTDSQGRLVLRDSGKIILPFEHFANAVMLKHMNSPHGGHLGMEATIRSVMDTYSIGRENFGMEKEFIVEMVENCPNPSCRYFKNQLDLTQKMQQHLSAPTYLTSTPTNSEIRPNNNFNSEFSMPIPPHLGISAMDLTGQNSMDLKTNLEQTKPVNTAQQQQLAMIQQQNRVIAQQNLDKFNPNLEKQRQQLQLQQQMDLVAAQKQKAHFEPVMEPKLNDFFRVNFDNIETSNKDLLALHNGAWSNHTSAPVQNVQEDKRNTSVTEAVQDKIIRGFAEIMKNMHRMKTCVRPAMCKPYGKQSESLQKTLMDTIQVIQTIRSFLPPSHIPVNSWKNDDKHRYEET